MNNIILNAPLDMHLHLRDGQMLNDIAFTSANTFSGALIMPNLVPPISSKEKVLAYKNRILNAVRDNKFEPFMTLFFKSTYDRKFLEDVKDTILALKLYPAGITTNSQDGVASFNLETLRNTLQAMSDLQIPLCIHGETEGFVMDRENEFLSIYEMLAYEFPKLKIIMEHITTKAAVDLLDKHSNLYATITLHHLLITLDDVAGGTFKPHLFCKPIAKRPEDRQALLQVALQTHPKVMFGSDSAPHLQNQKEACGCAAGIFTAPIALQVLCDIFDKHNKLHNLQTFISDNAQNIYEICPVYKEVTLVRKDFLVPKKYKNVVPMYANENLIWSIQKVL